jgi:nicotinate phosphoribosyltransferase
MDFAARAHDHNYRLDPIVRTRFDNDFYKLVMRQMIEAKHPMTRVRIAMRNRTGDVRLAEKVTIEEMREQLDHAQTLRYTPKELIWLRGNTFYGEDGMFAPDFIGTLKLSKLPDYELSIDQETGQFVLESESTWGDVSEWEMPFLTITNELLTRARMRDMSRSRLDIMYARAKTRLYAKLERILEHPDITISEFGTRRRHSFLWQQYVIQTMKEVLGPQFIGTSNTHFAMEEDCEAKGTNAHELPMVYAALAASATQGRPQDEQDAAIRGSQYEVLKDWQTLYHDRLRVFLPDTFGTTQFLAGAPEWVNRWTGARPDSKEPIEAGEELIGWWKGTGQDPTKKLVIFSDGMDVEIPGTPLNGSDIVAVHQHFRKRMIDSYGWGTNATNDFRGCAVGDPSAMKPISLVCKVKSVNGRAAVKISDNPAKATCSDPEELARYLRIFGHDGTDGKRDTLV